MQKLILCVVVLILSGIAMYSVIQRQGKSTIIPLTQIRDENLLPPQKITELFCKADYDGARLGGSPSSGEYERLSKHMVNPEGEFEPGWDTAVIVNDYRLSASSINDKSAKVVVTYNVLGTIAGAEELDIKKNREEIEFELVMAGPAWKLITPVDVHPHISKATAIQSLKDLINGNDKKRSEQLQRLISKIHTM